MQYTRQLEEKYNVDVFVAGGGAAGVAAAVAAARQGKKVFLAEATGVLGGLGTTGLVPAFAQFDDGKDFIATGIGFEIRQNVSKHIPLTRHFSSINAEELKREYDRILTESGVKFTFFTTVCDVITSGDKIDSVVLFSKSGMFTVKAKIYIDCTGDGDLCALGGGEFEIGDENNAVMSQTLCSLWTNIEEDRIVPGPQNRCIEQAYSDGVLTYEDRHLPGMFMGGYGNKSGIGGGNIGHTFNINPLDEESLTEAMIWGRKSMLEYEDYYKNYLNGYENMTLCTTSSVLGVRESRRIVCDYMLNVQDFIDRAVFEDEIGRYCYPVDIHVMNTDKDEYERFMGEHMGLRYSSGESYGIPYRSIVPVSFSNVLVAGRCIGADRQMQSSIRVMPGCFLTGQAAGVAAALASDSEDVRKIDIKELQQNLIRLGAYLPNA